MNEDGNNGCILVGYWLLQMPIVPESFNGIPLLFDSREFLSSATYRLYTYLVKDGLSQLFIR